MSPAMTHFCSCWLFWIWAWSAAACARLLRLCSLLFVGTLRYAAPNISALIGSNPCRRRDVYFHGTASEWIQGSGRVCPSRGLNLKRQIFRPAMQFRQIAIRHGIPNSWQHMRYIRSETPIVLQISGMCIDLHRLWKQQFSDNLPRIANAATVIGGRAYITFRTRPGPSLYQGGVEIEPSAILGHGQAQEYYQRSSGSAPFGTVSLPVDEIASVGAAMGELNLTLPRDANVCHAISSCSGKASAAARCSLRSGGNSSGNYRRS